MNEPYLQTFLSPRTSLTTTLPSVAWAFPGVLTDPGGRLTKFLFHERGRISMNTLLTYDINIRAGEMAAVRGEGLKIRVRERNPEHLGKGERREEGGKAS